MDAIDEAMDKSFEGINSLPWGALDAFASVFDGRADVLKSDALLARNVQRAYFEFTGLESVRHGIWCLGQGPSNRENVRKLKSGEWEAEDEGSAKVRDMLRDDIVDEDEAVATLTPVKNLPFTTKVGEQGHASTTEVEAEQKTCTRAGLACMRYALFSGCRRSGALGIPLRRRW